MTLSMLVALGVLVAAPNATAAPQLGLNDDWLSLPPTAVTAADGLGADIARFPVIAPAAERGPESSAWEPLDRTVASLRAANIRPLLVVCSEPCHAWSISPTYVSFIVSLAYRYPDAAIQVWNEPNLSGFEPAPYADLVRAVRAAVPAETQLVAGGAGPVWEWEAWTRRTFRRLRGLDLVPAVHLYPEARRLRSKKRARHARINSYVSDAYGDLRRLTGRRPWVTEVGFSSTTEFGSEAAQALGLDRALEALDDAGARFIVVHRLIEDPAHPHVWQQGLGLFRTDMTPKPAAEPVAELGAAG